MDGRSSNDNATEPYHDHALVGVVRVHEEREVRSPGVSALKSDPNVMGSWRRCWISSFPARAENRRFRLLSALRAHANAPRKIDLLWKTSEGAYTLREARPGPMPPNIQASPSTGIQVAAMIRTGG